MPLGSLHGPLEPLLGSLWTPKTMKHCKVFKVFANAGFWVFEALGGPLGPIFAPSWADLVPKWSPKWPPELSKQLPKTSPKINSNNKQINASFGLKNTLKSGSKNPELIGPGHPGHVC